MMNAAVTRDMTKRQFKERLKHYGIKQVLMWFERPDLPGVSIGAVCNVNGKINRRATLAKVLNFKMESRSKGN